MGRPKKVVEDSDLDDELDDTAVAVKSSKKLLSVRIDPELYRSVRVTAAQNDCRPSDIAEIALKAYVKSQQDD